MAESIKYIGASTHDLDLFEGQYSIPNGMAYNSYVIDDEKIAIMDTVDKIVTDKWLENLEKALSSIGANIKRSKNEGETKAKTSKKEIE